jgi:segregation and condensation protein B
MLEDHATHGQIDKALEALQVRWEPRGAQLLLTTSGWSFVSRTNVQPYLDRLHPEKLGQLTRSAMETLAIVAYRQPATRGDVEEIRGVAVRAQTIQTLEARGWIEVIGERKTPGNPSLYGTTRKFLDDLCLQSLDQLPELVASDLPAMLAAQLAGQATLPGAQDEEASPKKAPEKPGLCRAGE